MGIADIDFWKNGTRVKYEEAFDKMVKAGMKCEEADELLEGLYHATAGEYGD